MYTFIRSIPVLLVSLLLASQTVPLHAHEAAEQAAEAARAFLNALTPEQREAATFDFTDEERENWHFIPRERKGLAIKEMAGHQRQLAHALLITGLSHTGYIKANTIMNLEQVLAEIEGSGRRFSRDPELYFVSIFGKPSTEQTWGWRFEGHHLSLNFTLPDGHSLVVTPSFFGANPAEVRQGPQKGLRAMAGEEDMGRALVQSLSPDQRRKAVIAEDAYRDILTGAEPKIEPLDWTGIQWADLNKRQQNDLKKLVRFYAMQFRAEAAERDLSEIEEAGWDKLYFAWAGGIEPGQAHYYRVQGPTILIEYDNIQNNANHIHAVWREFKGDFGRDLLREHHRNHPHKN